MTASGLNGDVDGEYQIRYFCNSTVDNNGSNTYFHPIDQSGNDINGLHNQQWFDTEGTPVGGAAVGALAPNSMNASGTTLSTFLVLGQFQAASATDRSQGLIFFTAKSGTSRVAQAFIMDTNVRGPSAEHLGMSMGLWADTTTTIGGVKVSTTLATSLTSDSYLEVWAPRVVTMIVP